MSMSIPAFHVSDLGVPTLTSVENDCTRGPWAGGVPTPVSPCPGLSPATVVTVVVAPPETTGVAAGAAECMTR